MLWLPKVSKIPTTYNKLTICFAPERAWALVYFVCRYSKHLGSKYSKCPTPVFLYNTIREIGYTNHSTKMKKVFVLFVMLITIKCYSQVQQNYVSYSTLLTNEAGTSPVTKKERVYIVIDEDKKLFNFNFLDRKEGLIFTIYYSDYKIDKGTYYYKPLVNDRDVSLIAISNDVVGKTITLKYTYDQYVLFGPIEKQ